MSERKPPEGASVPEGRLGGLAQRVGGSPQAHWVAHRPTSDRSKDRIGAGEDPLGGRRRTAVDLASVRTTATDTGAARKGSAPGPRLWFTCEGHRRGRLRPTQPDRGHLRVTPNLKPREGGGLGQSSLGVSTLSGPIVPWRPSPVPCPATFLADRTAQRLPVEARATEPPGFRKRGHAR